MHVVMVDIRIKPEARDTFLEAMYEDARCSINNEPDCLHFNVIQDADEPDVIHLYEVYASPEAFERHKQTPHFAAWLEATKDLLAEPLVIRQGECIHPCREHWVKQK